MLLADTVRVNAEGAPEILTKIAKDFVSVSYNINDKVKETQRESKGDTNAGHDLERVG